MKKLLAGLCTLVFFVGSGLALADGGNGEKGEQQCSPTNLSVGYVDNDDLQEHKGSFFPSPWLGNGCGGTNTKCIFIGTPGPNGEWDAGALKIDNPSSTTSLTVDNVTVDIGTDTGIDPWTSSLPVKIPPGGSLILTEDHNQFNFDTSDDPPRGIEITPSCRPDGDIPIIHVTVGTSTQVVRNFVDTAQVLNTGGIDIGECPVPGSGENEGHPFVEVQEQKNHCECEDHDERGDQQGQNGGAQDNGNQN